MKFIRLVVGIVVMAATCLMGGVIVHMLREHQESKYVSSASWGDENSY